MTPWNTVHTLAIGGLAAATTASAASLGSYNVDPESISVSGLSSGGFMAAQLGIAYSDTFKTGFGVFAGGPYDCARNQYYTMCMYNMNPSITTPIANMQNWSGAEIDDVANLKDRRVYMQVGTSDTTVGPNVMAQLKAQLAEFATDSNTVYITTDGAAHTFPTDFDGAGNSPCGVASSPFVSNCGYDGAGEVLKWMYGELEARNDGAASGEVLEFEQTGSYGADGMGSSGYIYIPAVCTDGLTACRLHVALHGCQQSYGQIQAKFIENTGYNKWADTNNIIILYPQATTDNTMHPVWNGGQLPNPNACWDWVGWYGADADQKGGVQMAAIVSQVIQITSGSA
ncbi:Alpha/Beta hydrolase protein [Aspergillus lucknowensis]|uniref:Alpha/Beta hydrolase protein n=1 Tax=Aspergillus lucknowensis TaxID=176173 RepID=A0ABR4LS89_9EURO